MTKINQKVITAAEEWVTTLMPDFHFKESLEAPKSQRNKLLVFLCNKELRKAIEAIREEFTIPVVGLKDKVKAKEWAEKLYCSPKNKTCYFNEISRLLEVFNASQRWENALQYYVLFNKKSFDHLIPLPFDAGIRVDEENKRHLSLELYSDTTLEDIKLFWPEISALKTPLDRFQDDNTNTGEFILVLDKSKKKLTKSYVQKTGRLKKPFDLPGNLKIYDLKNKGLKYKEIAETVKLNQKTISYDDVSRILNRFEKIAKKTKLY